MAGDSGVVRAGAGAADARGAGVDGAGGAGDVGDVGGAGDVGSDGRGAGADAGGADAGGGDARETDAGETGAGGAVMPPPFDAAFNDGGLARSGTFIGRVCSSPDDSTGRKVSIR